MNNFKHFSAIQERFVVVFFEEKYIVRPTILKFLKIFWLIHRSRKIIPEISTAFRDKVSYLRALKISQMVYAWTVQRDLEMFSQVGTWLLWSVYFVYR
jgi:hypothetical protein